MGSLVPRIGTRGLVHARPVLYHGATFQPSNAIFMSLVYFLKVLFGLCVHGDGESHNSLTSCLKSPCLTPPLPFFPPPPFFPVEYQRINPSIPHFYLVIVLDICLGVLDWIQCLVFLIIFSYINYVWVINLHQGCHIVLKPGSDVLQRFRISAWISSSLFNNRENRRLTVCVIVLRCSQRRTAALGGHDGTSGAACPHCALGWVLSYPCFSWDL